MSTTAPPQRARTAVVLSGGGANGAYEVGVLKALLAGRSPSTGCEPFVPAIFAGTSIGSFNAAFLAAQWDANGSTATGNLERVWLDRLASGDGRGNGAYRLRGDVFELFRPAAFLANPLQPWLQLGRDAAYLGWDGVQRGVHLVAANEEGIRQRAAELFNFASFVSVEPWRQTIERSIDFSFLRRSTRRLRVTATNWMTGEPKVFVNLDMTDGLGPKILMASSAIPGVFPPVMIGAEPHVDGGVLMNTPLKPATDAGADVLHVIYLDPDPRRIPMDDLQSTVGTAYRMQSISWAERVNDDIEDAEAINKSLELLAELDQPAAAVAAEPGAAPALSRSIAKVMRRARAKRRYRPLTVHRYRPRDELSAGSLGMLNLDPSHIAALIDRGFSDAVQHDCAAAGCVLPFAGRSAAERAALLAALEEKLGEEAS